MGRVISLVFAAMVFVFVGCGSNLENVKSEGDSKIPTSKTFNGNFQKVWSSCVSALAENETLKVSEKDSGMIVTELRAIDGKELSLVSTYFLGSTYKYSYTIRVKEKRASSTDVTVNVKLAKEQLVFVKRETKDEQVEGYLRKKLFEKIAEFM